MWHALNSFAQQHAYANTVTETDVSVVCRHCQPEYVSFVVHILLLDADVVRRGRRAEVVGLQKDRLKKPGNSVANASTQEARALKTAKSTRLKQSVTAEGHSLPAIKHTRARYHRVRHALVSALTVTQRRICWNVYKKTILTNRHRCALKNL